MRETVYQKHIKDRLKETFIGCHVLKNDPNELQGIPDLTVHYGKKWAYLEVKKSEHEHRQPNQAYYIEKANREGSFGSFIYPENEDYVFEDLIIYFNF